MLSQQQGTTAEHSRKQHRLIGFQFLAGPRPPAPHAGRRPRGRRQAARQRGDERQLGVLRERGGGGCGRGADHTPRRGQERACKEGPRCCCACERRPPPAQARASQRAATPCVPASAARWRGSDCVHRRGSHRTRHSARTRWREGRGGAPTRRRISSSSIAPHPKGAAHHAPRGGEGYTL